MTQKLPRTAVTPEAEVSVKKNELVTLLNQRTPVASWYLGQDSSGTHIEVLFPSGEVRGYVITDILPKSAASLDGVPPGVALVSGSAGVAATASRSDHTHGHGDLSGDSVVKHQFPQISGSISLAQLVPHNVLSAQHADTTPATAVRGDLIVALAAGDWGRLALSVGLSGVLAKDQTTGQPSWRLLIVSDIPAHALLSPTHIDTTTSSPLLGDLVGSLIAGTWTRVPIGPADNSLSSDGANLVYKIKTKMVSADETQVSATVPNTDTTLKSFALPANQFSFIEVEAGGYLSIAAKATIQDVNFKVKDGGVQKGNTEVVQIGTVSAGEKVPFDVEATFLETAAKTLTVTHGAAAADANSTTFLNYMKVKGYF